MPTIIIPRPENRSRRGISFAGTESKTKQSFKKDADINNIISKYVKTGVPPAAGNRQPMYGDFSSETDYRDVVDRIKAAEMEFSKLNSDVRKQFKNDPGNMIAFMADPNNAEECISLGLLPDPNLQGLESAAPSGTPGASVSNQPDDSSAEPAGSD